MQIAIFGGAFYLFYIIVIFWDGKKKGHVRGAQLLNYNHKKGIFNKLIQKVKTVKKKNPDSIYIGDVELPRKDEDKQTLILGRPGAGKTTIFNSIIDKLIERNSKAIIYDIKGDYIQKFYDPEKDLILNIADARSLKWSIANEISDKADLVSLAESLIPRATGTEQHWNDTARGVFTAILRLAVLQNKKANKDIFNVINKPVADIFKYLSDNKQPESVYISNPKNSSDVMSTLMRYVSWLEYAEDGDFKIKDWINDKNKRFIFISNSTKITDVQKPLLTLFIDLFVKTYLSLPDDISRRMYFLLDEFGTLNKLSAIKDMLILGRSKGLCSVLGVQDVGQIDAEYQEQTRNTIINACSNVALLAQNDPNTAKLAAEILGQSEQWEDSHSADESGTGSTTQNAKQIKYLVLPSEFQSMDNLTAFVRILKNWQFTDIKYVSYDNKNESFILNNSFEFQTTADPDGIESDGQIATDGDKIETAEPETTIETAEPETVNIDDDINNDNDIFK
jgi:type IV secretory pathway TraG/TraD family ATPase VirD4